MTFPEHNMYVIIKLFIGLCVYDNLEYNICDPLNAIKCGMARKYANCALIIDVHKLLE